MPQISAVIITYNEELFIGTCLESLKGVVDEIVVIDSFSTDRTEEICKEYNVRFFKHAFGGYRDQKNYALTFATYNHVLSVDADEALSEELCKSILAIKDNWEHDGYFVSRRNNFCGKWIKHSGWYPDRQLRLFRIDSGAWGVLNIHERFILHKKNAAGRLKGDLLHWPCSSEEEHLEKMRLYSEISANEYYKAGRSSSFFTPFLHGFWRFFRTYVLNGGFLDGREGYLICSVYGKSTYTKYRRLRILIREGVSQK